MDPVSKAILGVYLGSLGLLGALGGSEAVAQGLEQGTVPPSAVALASPVGTMVVDLGNLTMPGAMVVCTVLVLRHLAANPWRPTVVLEHRYPDAAPTPRLVRD